nr:hypothetical protein CFP56_13373 [Quercus suber]
MTDETLFPPRCDGKEIPLNRVRFFLPADLANEFDAKSVELSTKNRICCHDPHCSTFIPLTDTDSVAEWVTCPRCSKTTCTICKAASHTGDCPDDTSLQQLVQTAEAEQWQRCYQCHRFVELDTGCNHMTYCGCVQFDERNLLARAAAIADRPHNPGRQLFRPERAAMPQPLNDVPPEIQRTIVETTQQRDRRIRALVEDLRVNHICAHEKWRWVGGPHECEECHHNLPSYIFEYRQCHLQACNRCRRNRLA